MGPQPVTVASASGLSCNGGNFTDTILLVLSSPLITDGNYKVVAKNGSDGNTQIDSCGLLQMPGDTIGFNINSFDGKVIARPDTLVCDPGYIPFYATDNSDQPATYRWSPGVFLNDSTQLQTVGYIAQDITYTILAIDKDGCPHRDRTTITLSERQPSLVPLHATICRGDEITLNAYGGKTYNWMSADIASLNCSDCPSPDASPKETMVYSVSISDENNCSDTLSTTITVNQLPIVTATPNDTTVLYNTDLQLAASGATKYSWVPTRYINYPSSPAPIITIKDPVIIVVTGVDENGCSNRDTIKVGVDYRDVVVIPSAFTPNGDGKNDIFMVGSFSFQHLEEFRIFNRWGQELFHTINPKEGWDGSYKGQPQDMGVYEYIIKVSYPNGKVDTYKGDVTLVR
jgi:gliding motility-associated-like protein